MSNNCLPPLSVVVSDKDKPQLEAFCKAASDIRMERDRYKRALEEIRDRGPVDLTKYPSVEEIAETALKGGEDE